MRNESLEMMQKSPPKVQRRKKLSHLKVKPFKWVWPLLKHVLAVYALKSVKSLMTAMVAKILPDPSIVTENVVDGCIAAAQVCRLLPFPLQSTHPLLMNLLHPLLGD